MRTFLNTHIPDLPGDPTRSQVCMYTVTPDRHFVVDIYPAKASVVVACGFSGHGFKFAPVVGDILADLADEGQVKHPIGLFSAKRFASK